MIELENVRAVVGRRVVLDGCSAALSPGTITHLAGRNGSGKTTLIRAIAGIQRYSGSIRFNGADVARVRSQLYVCFDDAPVFPYLSGYENVRMLVGSNLRRRTIAGVAPTLADDSLLRLSARKLSHGQRKRLHLVAAFASGARYLLLDEALNGLDAPTVSEFGSALRAEAADLTVLLTGHHEETYGGFASHRLEIVEGRLVANDLADGVADGVAS